MTRSPGAPRRRSWPFIIAALAVAGFLVGGAIEHGRRSHVDVPAAPTNVRATTLTCAPPDCGTIRAKVTLSWEAATDGDPATRLAILRDGVGLPGQQDLPPATEHFVDESVEAGSRHTYAVVAANAAGTSTSAQVGATLPFPPLSAARLEGAFRVALVARRAVNLASLQGIPHPRRGSKGAATWLFVDPCAPNSAPCPARWRGHVGVISPKGAAWTGTVTGPRAACLGGEGTSAPVRLGLVVKGASMIGGVWLVSRFEGSSSVRFHCDGFTPSHGVVEIVGTRR
jgi:hypothetical protein